MIDDSQDSLLPEGRQAPDSAQLSAVISSQRDALAAALDGCGDPVDQVRIQEVLLTLDVLAAGALERIPERIARDLAQWISHSANMGVPELRRAATRSRRAAEVTRKAAKVVEESEARSAASAARVAARHDEIAATSEHLVPGGRL